MILIKKFKPLSWKRANDIESENANINSIKRKAMVNCRKKAILIKPKSFFLFSLSGGKKLDKELPIPMSDISAKRSMKERRKILRKLRLRLRRKKLKREIKPRLFLIRDPKNRLKN